MSPWSPPSPNLLLYFPCIRNVNCVFHFSNGKYFSSSLCFPSWSLEVYSKPQSHNNLQKCKSDHMTPFKASSSFLPPLEKIIHTPYLGLHDLAPACLSSLALPILLLIAILLPSWPITCIFASGPLCLPLLPSAENTVSPELPWLPLSLHSGVCTNISILDRLSLTLYLIQDTHAFPICTHSLYPSHYFTFIYNTHYNWHSICLFICKYHHPSLPY